MLNIIEASTVDCVTVFEVIRYRAYLYTVGSIINIVASGRKKYKIFC
jgi:hypothetical protein